MVRSPGHTPPTIHHWQLLTGPPAQGAVVTSARGSSGSPSDDMPGRRPARSTQRLAPPILVPMAIWGGGARKMQSNVNVL